jgi:heavy metal sensor kinase
MKSSIRTRLTLLITLVYLCVFFFIVAAGALALHIVLEEAIDKRLTTELGRMTTLLEHEVAELLTATPERRRLVTARLLDQLHQIYNYSDEFVILSLETESARRVYGDGRIKNIQLLLPRGFLSQPEGFYDQRLGGVLHRVLIAKPGWGTLVLGAENQSFIEVAEQFKTILVIGLPLTLLLVLAGGRFLAHQAMRPVLTTAAATEHITLTNLDERLPEYYGKDEFGKLVDTLNLMIARLQQGVHRIQQFTQDAAHELRTPLTVLRGELELVFEQTDVPDEVLASLQKSLDRAIAMSQIVENLMLLAQSDTGNYPIQRCTFRLDELLRELVDDMTYLIEDNLIEVRLAHCENVDFSGDRQLMQRLLLNLSDNARKHTERGFVEFGLRKTGDKIDLSVRDSGKGIPPEKLPYIFDRFYRLDSARSRATGGSGLGLAICKWVVELHGGTIRIDSRPHEGTTVTVLLPADRHARA